MKRDAMGLGADTLTLFCEDGHKRLDLAYVDVSGEPSNWRGFVAKNAVEGRTEHPGHFFLPGSSDYCSWTAQIRGAAAGQPWRTKENPLRIECPRCRGRTSNGRTVRVKGRVLRTIVDNGLTEASLEFVEGFMRRG